MVLMGDGEGCMHASGRQSLMHHTDSVLCQMEKQQEGPAAYQYS